MSYATEFPTDFAPSADILAAIPSHWRDESWGNDVCPHWTDRARNVAIWIDHADPAQREGFSKRFTVTSPIDESDGLIDAVLETDSIADAVAFVATLPLHNPRNLAVAFVNGLRAELGHYKFGELRARASKLPSSGACITHDYCDANMTMDAAFRATFGRPFDMDSDSDSSLWNDAWHRAREAAFNVEHL